MRRSDWSRGARLLGRARAARRIAAVALLMSCSPDAPATPAVLRIAAVPEAAPALVREQHAAVVEEVCRRAELRCAWVEVGTYQELVDAIGRGAVDVAYLGGATFAQARRRHGAIPLAIRDIDASSTSAVIVRSDSAARALADLRGKPFAFGSAWSTSGAVMPRYFLERAGLDPGRAFSRVVFSGRHDATVRMVADGEVAGGAVDASILLRLAAEGDAAASRVRVLWRSPPFADSVWAARKELPAAVRQRLLDAFLDLDPSVPAHRAALRRESASGFLPASEGEWELVTGILAGRGEL